MFSRFLLSSTTLHAQMVSIRRLQAMKNFASYGQNSNLHLWEKV